MNNSFSPTNTLIAFDLNGVVISHQSPIYREWLATHPEFVKVLPCMPHDGEPSEIFAEVLTKDPEMHGLVKECFKAFTAAGQIEQTCELVGQLMNYGYRVIPASNITKTSYLAMVDNGTIPHFNKEHHFTLTHPFNKKPDGTYHKKPAPDYFANLHTYVKEQWPHIEHIIFIDDQEANTKVAQTFGMISVYVEGPQQLRQQLQWLGIHGI
jgi:FMN phosphatase YigB (HAD superfamily)